MGLEKDQNRQLLTEIEIILHLIHVKFWIPPNILKFENLYHGYSDSLNSDIEKLEKDKLWQISGKKKLIILRNILKVII